MSINERSKFKDLKIAPIILSAALVTWCQSARSDDAQVNDINNNVTETHASSRESLAYRALTKAIWLFDNTQENHYAHVSGSADKQVEVSDANVATDTDCSGFISFVLKSVARKHYEEVIDFNGGRRPRADNYAQFFAQLNAQPNKGWLEINSIEELQPGDLIAWESPHYEKYHEGNTGHVMMVLASPGHIKEETVAGEKIRFIGIPVIDSSSVSHFPPETLPPLTHQSRRDGVGKGTIRLVLDSSNKPIAYWEGTYWGEGEKSITKPTNSNIIYFARIIGFKQQ
jgi:hypothetical protein